MDPEANRLLAALFAAGIRSQFDSLFRCVGLAQGEVLAEPLQRMRRVYFPFSGLISFLVPLADGSLIQTGVVGSDGAVGSASSPRWKSVAEQNCSADAEHSRSV